MPSELQCVFFKNEKGKKNHELPGITLRLADEEGSGRSFRGPEAMPRVGGCPLRPFFRTSLLGAQSRGALNLALSCPVPLQFRSCSLKHVAEEAGTSRIGLNRVGTVRPRAPGLLSRPPARLGWASVRQHEGTEEAPGKHVWPKPCFFRGWIIGKNFSVDIEMVFGMLTLQLWDLSP